MAELDVTDATFEAEVIEKSKTIPVLVDFWASWCGPCRILKPVLEKVAQDYEGKVILAKVSVEENEESPQKYAVMSIPSVKLFKDGKITAEFVGAKPEQDIRDFLDDNL
ncbi:thioredoxin [archaeon]|jgi:putative thioredoxin|nr:thioredoxin [archaeon]MBT6182485.1 thioredoxin [archaeon]MBT6606627.1 thioredoxin [archaeon]MBT7251870.1 thioredoxin [archaeon]MBT7660558.1 thioredoxin [archaeon]